MQKRRVKYIIFMIDHRHLDSPSNLDHQLAWKFLVDTIVADRWPSGRKKKEVDYPMAVGIWLTNMICGERSIKVISP